MEGLPGKVLQGLPKFGTGSLGQFKPAAVGGVTEQRVIAVGHVDPDLVGTPCFQMNRQGRVVLKAFVNEIMGDRGLTAGHYRHSGPNRWMPGDRRIHRPSAGQGPAADCGVDPFDGPRRQLLYQ